MAFNIVETVQENARILHLHGDIDGEEQWPLRYALMEAMKRPESAIILDMGEVGAIDSDTMRVILDSHGLAKFNDKELVLSGVPEKPAPLFKASRLHRIVDFYPDNETALRALSAKAAPKRGNDGVTIFTEIDALVAV